MILTVCPNPSIVVNMEVDSLSVGMSNKIINKRTYFSGEALNIAVGLVRLGVEAFATGFLYESNGNQFERELHYEGVPYKFIWNKGRVREIYKFVDRKSMLTEVYESGCAIASDKQEELIEFVREQAVKSECVILSGELAEGMDEDYYERLLSVVPEDVVKVVDAEGDCLKCALKCGVDLVKPNLAELERFVRYSVKSREEVKTACRAVVKAGAKYVLLSLGKQGAVITDGSKFYYSKSVNVAMNSTIGAGDSMVAGAAAALVRGQQMQDILLCGVAAGTAAVTSPDSISFTRDKYNEILSALEIKEM